MQLRRIPPGPEPMRRSPASGRWQSWAWSLSWIVASLVASVCCDAATPAPATGHAYTVERLQREIVLHTADHVEEFEETRLRVDTADGIDAVSELRRTFTEGHGSVTVLEAYTLQADGTRVDVPPEGILTRKADSPDGSEISDTRERVILFPDVRVGSRIRFRLHTVDRLAAYPGHAIVEAWFAPHTPVESATLSFRYAASLPLRFDARGAVGEPLADEAGMRRMRFRYRRTTAVPPDPAQVGPADISDYVLATTFRDHIALGQAYQASARAMATVTPQVRTLAEEVTRALATERARVRALYEWVQRNIRYRHLRLGSETGMVPHAADWVLANRFGDCKDHVTVLEALLAAVGIDSSPALINSAGSYRLPPVAVATPLDHVITYVPKLDLYLDSTAKDAPFGTLPWSLSDKPVILSTLGRLGRTPPPLASQHVLRRSTHFRVLPSGEVMGISHHWLTGLFATPWRREGARVAAPLTEDEVAAMLRPALESGTGSRDWIRGPTENGPMEFRSSFQLDPIVDPRRPAAMTVPVGLGAAYLHTLIGQRPPARRPFPYPCRSMMVSEHSRITLPPEVSVISLPRDASFRDGIRLYRARYAARGTTVEVNREYFVSHPGAVCEDDDHLSRTRVHRIIALDLRQAILLRPRRMPATPRAGRPSPAPQGTPERS
jgi:transglutaminase-like putative cysteine protease